MNKKKHGRNECPLNPMEICGIFGEQHENKKFPSLPGMKAIYQGIEENMKKLCFVN
jgi:hypothetical protein